MTTIKGQLSDPYVKEPGSHYVIEIGSHGNLAISVYLNNEEELPLAVLNLEMQGDSPRFIAYLNSDDAEMDILLDAPEYLGRGCLKCGVKPEWHGDGCADADDSMDRTLLTRGM